MMLETFQVAATMRPLAAFKEWAHYFRDHLSWFRYPEYDSHRNLLFIG
jgi:hypothetical protein